MSTSVVTDAFWMEDVDLTDEMDLRRLVSLVERLLGRGDLQVSVLNIEQWEVAVERLVPPRLRRGVVCHFHIIREPHDREHLLIGPSGIRGLNQRSRTIWAEVTYALVQARLQGAPPLIARGAADLAARLIRERMGVDFFATNYPDEADLVRGMIVALREDGRTGAEWLREIAENPRGVLKAFAATDFARGWLQAARRDARWEKDLGDAPRRQVLVQWLADPALEGDAPFVTFTRDCLHRWEREGA